VRLRIASTEWQVVASPTKVTNFLPRSTIVTFISHAYEIAKLGKFGQAIMDVKEDGYFKKIDKHTSSCRIFPTV
jgi:hypothetical protein